MKTIYFTIIAGLLVASCSNGDEAATPEMSLASNGSQQGSAPASPGKMPEGALRVQQAKVIDSSGFEKPLVAATIMVPFGWQTQGGIVWQQEMAGCGKNTPHVNWEATAPDGIGKISLLPDESWSGNNLQFQDPGQSQCPNMWVTDAKQAILGYVQRYRPNATLYDYRDRQEAIKDIQKLLIPQQRDSFGTETRQWAGAGQALIGYMVNGKEVREVIGTAVIFNLVRMPGVMPGEVREFLTIGFNPGYAMRMADGQLSFKQAEMFRLSGRPGQEWSAKMAQHRAKMNKINSDGAADRAAISAKANREIADMQMDTWRKNNESGDRMQREEIETIRGVETYDDPYNGGTVQLDNTYQNAWQLNDGSYVLTDDPSFDPYSTTGLEGRQLETTQ